MQKYAVEHKQTLLKTAGALKYVGDKTGTVGTTAAIAGAPIDGIGALPGLFIASVGKGEQITGVLLEVTTNILTENYKSAAITGANEAVYAGLGALGDAAVHELLPGAPDASKPINLIIKQSLQMTNGAIKTQTDKTVDKIKDQ